MFSPCEGDELTIAVLATLATPASAASTGDPAKHNATAPATGAVALVGARVIHAPRRNRAAKNCAWIDKYCTVPAGLDRGRRVRLTPAQRDVMRRIYDGNEIVEVTPPLSAYLVLLHLCGPEAVLRGEADFSFRNEKSFKADVFTTWSSAGPDLKEVLTLHGEHIVCPELGTRFPAAA